MRTIFDITPSNSDLDISNYHYQDYLTSQLDALDSDFDQSIVNEIVLWKLNRYVKLDKLVLDLINKISKKDTVIDSALTGEILLKLLQKDQKGARIAMATTLLRFKNPYIYQIMDQRVYRFLYGIEMSFSLSDINKQILTYLDYLTKLREVSDKYNIPFELSDRILYKMDKDYNDDLKLKGF